MNGNTDPNYVPPPVVQRCAICGDPLPPGWPVVWTDAGWAHRFSTMCRKEKQGESR